MLGANDHLDLFTGLGGFSLAAEQAGFTTRLICEYDDWRRAGLERAWAGRGIEFAKDVRELDGTKYRGAGLLTAGVPCQPASRAGKRRGAGDDRWLWPATLAFVRDARPIWCLFENPPGIEDVGLDGILADVEDAGYTIGPILDIPACAVNAPHRRSRLWVVAHSYEAGRPGEYAEPGAHGLRAEHCEGVENSTAGQCGTGAKGTAPADRENHHGAESANHADRPVFNDRAAWDSYCWVPCADGKFRRAPGPIEQLADGAEVDLLEALVSGQMKAPRKLLAALGDSIVWPLAAEILWAMKGADEHGY